MKTASIAADMNGAGCIFDHYGRIPEALWSPCQYNSPLEEAVYQNNLEKIKELIKSGENVSVRLKIGGITCLEYAAMKGYADMLELLLRKSSNFKIIEEYFALEDIVEKAYMISKNKSIFFNQEALAEINRYEAAFFTAIEYNQPACLDVLINLGFREPGTHCFWTNGDGAEYDKMTAKQLATTRNHTKCLEVLEKRLPHIK